MITFLSTGGGINMKLPRRQFLHLAAGAAVLPASLRCAWAQAYPTRPVRIMVGFPPGGAYDTLARPMGQWLSERLRQAFIIDNRPGAGSNLATEAVARAAPDGHTLLMIGPTQVMNVALYDKLNFDFLRDIAPVGGITLAPLVMVVNPSFAARTVPEFIAYAKANAGKVNMASSGNGVINHIVGELFKMATGVDMVHVPYRGGAPALTDLLGGQVQVMFATISSSIEYIRSGKLRALAVTTAKRCEALPDAPAIAETVPGFEANDWYGIGATKGTPPEIIAKLNTEINAGLGGTKMKEHLAVLGGVPMPTTPADFGQLMANEAEKWGKVIRAAKIRVE
jgi:tripartite-type tricarboxylate transporter receptor subunit TctC